MDKNQIKIQLQKLGLCSGDVVFISSDLMRVGYFNENPQKTIQDWMDMFQEILGSEGTIVIPTYSPSTFRFFRKFDFVYTLDSISSSGSLANAYIQKSKTAIRSAHPTTSCIAVGKYAEEIVGSHGPESSAYFPYGKVIELGGKNLMLGTVDEKNCPMPFHYAQEILGHTRTHPLSGLLRSVYVDKVGGKKLFIVKEVGGCTRGVHKTWGYHLAQNAVVFQRVGRSLSALVDTQLSYEILINVLRETPSLIKCDNKLCISCYGRYRYNGFDSAALYVRKTYEMIHKILKN